MVAAKIELIQAELLKSHKSNLINEYGNKNGGNDGGLVREEVLVDSG